MPFTGIASPAQLELLHKILDEHCASRGITDPRERESVAELVMSLFSAGATDPKELKEALARYSQIKA